MHHLACEGCRCRVTYANRADETVEIHLGEGKRHLKWCTTPYNRKLGYPGDRQKDYPHFPLMDGDASAHLCGATAIIFSLVSSIPSTKWSSELTFSTRMNWYLRYP